MESNWATKTSLLTVREMKAMLKSTGGFYNLKSRVDYETRIDTIKKVLNFTWRKEQKEVIEAFLKSEHENYIVHAIFGSGKTTLMLGLIIYGIVHQVMKPCDCTFISFNVSIKNEIKRKLGQYGIGSKVQVRTFDSLIYEVAKVGEYKYIDLPNFEGKRKFVYEIIHTKDFGWRPTFQPTVVFLDECQDLEYSTYVILRYLYPKARFIMAGDIFQSIQKEPRESMLWYFMNVDKSPSTYKIYMCETPRVPPNVLVTLKAALSVHYPEYKDTISKWHSGNKVSNADIEWRRLNSYTAIFKDLKDFLGCHTPESTMILTFSAAITVRGAMGDLARVRRFMLENNIKVNYDHKKLEPDSYFLSTANSSKGLERDYVIIFLTFPLEKAFIHLSDDVVLNLITVALTRAKKKVIMYVPAYEDKYSRVLTLFRTCPTPTKPRIHDHMKGLNSFTFQDYFDNEHCVTELIRMGVIKYDTRLFIKEHTKIFSFGKIFDDDCTYKAAPILIEEERAFVGVLIENLITSTWLGYWPRVDIPDKMKGNPMYGHLIGRMQTLQAKFSSYTRSHPYCKAYQFEGIYLFTQVFIAINNRLFIKLSDGLYGNLKKYWEFLRPKAKLFKPKGDKLKVQAPVQMPWITGIADASCMDIDQKTMVLYELKASQMREWKDDALLQVMCYALMSGKTWFRLHLYNPFRNEQVSYYFDTKNILYLRKKILNDIFVWNTNSMMAKTYPLMKDMEPLEVRDTLFLNMVIIDGHITQASLLNMLSPIRCEILYNKYVSSGQKKTKDMKKEDRYACEESCITEDEIIKELNAILAIDIHKDKIIWSFEKYDTFLKVKTKSIKDKYELTEFDQVIKSLGYENKTEDTGYTADTNDSVIRNLFSLSFLFNKHRFVV